MPLASYTIDAVHSSVGFAVRHLVISKVRGQFTKFSGTFAFDPDDLSKSHVAVSIDAAVSARAFDRDNVNQFQPTGGQLR